MIKIISPDQFKTIPWKNGQGQTTELAISPNGTLNDFDWRLSIASVVDEGLFSDFSAYDRQLILLKGNGIKLTHDKQQVDELKTTLSIAVFDGACRTVGELIDGPIEDFNVMTRQGRFKAKVTTFPQQHSITCTATGLNFIYAMKKSMVIQFNQENIELPAGHLLQISSETGEKIQISGQDFIVIALHTLAEHF
jgi:environmental stress-induced protein Ves